MAKTNMNEADAVGDESLLDDLEIDSIAQTDEKIDKNTNQKTDDKTGTSLSLQNLAMIKELLGQIDENSRKIKDILLTDISPEDEAKISIGQYKTGNEDGDDEENGGRVIEGVFNGESMFGPDGKQYSVPANYASKSKLVEGDILKLSITPNGTFVYKQIGPIDRIRLIGNLEKDSEGGFVVNTEKKPYKVLTASVTYFKGQAGDEVVILVPKNSDSNWAAVENIVKKV